jgi:hypothetical protein
VQKKHITALPNFGVFALCSFFILSCVQNLLGSPGSCFPSDPIFDVLTDGELFNQIINFDEYFFQR